MVKEEKRHTIAQEIKMPMEVPQEQRQSRDGNDPREVSAISEREVPQPPETRPDPVVTLQDAEHLVAELLNAIGHEFRTPLAVIQGYSSMLLLHEERLAAEERHELHHAIQEAATRLGSLVEKVLELAQLEAGAVQLAQGTVDILTLTRDRKSVV